MRNIIFLDIDGVLNSNLWNETHQGKISNGILIDEEKIRLLKKIVEKTNAGIILHSGWRFWFDSNLKPLRKEAECLSDLLEKEGLKIEGVTPDLTTEEIRENKKFSMVKAKEILLWLTSHEDVGGWVVLDDLDLHNDTVEEHQIKTDQMVGLTLENVREAEKIILQSRITANIISLSLQKCIDIFNEMKAHAEEAGKNKYGTFPLTMYIEQQETIHVGRTRLSDHRNTINTWKFEKEKLLLLDKAIKIPGPVVTKMYFDRAHFIFEIENSKVKLQYYFGPRFGRGMEFDIVDADEKIRLAGGRTIWVS